MYLFKCHFHVAWRIWSEFLTNLAITKMHMPVPRMNCTTVNATFHVCVLNTESVLNTEFVLNTELQTVASSNCTTDTVRQSFVKEWSALVDMYLWHSLSCCKCHTRWWVWRSPWCTSEWEHPGWSLSNCTLHIHGESSPLQSSWWGFVKVWMVAMLTVSSRPKN